MYIIIIVRIFSQLGQTSIILLNTTKNRRESNLVL